MAPQRANAAAQRLPQGASRAWKDLTPAPSAWVLDAVSSMGFNSMTPVQASTIPLFTGNKDVVVEAVTGSGKTLSFLVPVVEKLLRLEECVRRHHIAAIIISPTRELATQIHAVLLTLLAFHPPSAAYLSPLSTSNPPADRVSTLGSSDSQHLPTLSIVSQLLVGGTTPPSQDLAHFLTHSPNLLVSTPGRLLELLSSPHVHCPQSSFEVLVLDEADRLLDLGFKDDLQKILQRLPKQRRTGLFSASVSEAVDQLVRVGLRNPVRIAVKVKGKDGAEDQRTPASLSMAYLTAPPTLKFPHLLNLITHLDQPPQKTIAYLSTCAAVDYFSLLLRHALPVIDKSLLNLSIIPLHGRQSASHRNKNLAKFTESSEPSLLLTTDLASRGLDIPLVDLTVQLDPPSDPKTFLHRAGRAGRAGRRGLAVVFLTPGRESEEYPSFLSVRKTPVKPLREVLFSSSKTNSVNDEGARTALDKVSDEQGHAFTTKFRAVAQLDRALHDKAQRAFVSFVRSYSKHAASSIFRVSELNWLNLADAWGLLRLPRMPELKKRGQAATAVARDVAGNDEKAAKQQQDEEIDRGLSLHIDWENYAYRDKQQEAKRRREMLAQQSESQLALGTRAASAKSVTRSDGQDKNGKIASSSSWSAKAAMHETAAARRAKKASKRVAVRRLALSEDERRKERELEGMIAEVRLRNMEEFNGFPD